MIRLSLPGEYTDLNTYSTAERAHRHKAAEIKRDETERVWAEVMSQKNREGLRIEKYPITIAFHWFAPDKRKDPDNIAFAKKFLLDGCQDAGLIENDGWKQIAGFSDSFHIDKESPRVEMVITW